MSKQMTNVDIEDVLTSIRRLVAEGDHKKMATDASWDEPNASPDKLLLTPNFRVKEEEKSPDSAIEAPQVSTQDADAVLVLQPEQSIPDQDIAPEIPTSSLEATIAGLEARLSEADQEWEPDGSEIESSEPTWSSVGFVASRASDAIDTAEVAQDTVDQVHPGIEDMDEPVVAASRLTLEPEMRAQPAVDEFVPYPRPHRWSEHSEHRLAPRADDEDTDYGDELALAAQSSSDELLDKYLNQDPVIDEAMLRRVVQEVLREELQGHLGERITRNVRKLVRREIHNILTTQEFE